MSKDKEHIESILQLIVDIASGKFASNIPQTYQNDELDAIIEGLNMLGEELNKREVKLKEQEKQLLISQKMESLGTLSGGIAHEFNNMLAPMLGHTEILLNKCDVGSQQQYHLKQIQAAGIRASDLVRQVMSFSRTDSPTFAPLDLATTIQKAISFIKPSIPDNINIHQSLCANCDPILADSTQIHQIIINLFNNAYHAMEDGGGILKVTSEQLEYFPPTLNMGNDSCIRVTVSDTGGGILPEHQEKIFDPFFTTKVIGKGTGLGLSVVHGLVEQHRGKITVDSEIGKGTTFSIYLPVHKTNIREWVAGEKESISESIASKKDRGRILLVEDDPGVAELHSTFLTESGYIVTLCRDGKEALDVFNKDSSLYDVVFTDQSMPRMTGKQLSQEIHKIKPNMPIILSSGFGGLLTEKEIQELGVSYYLKKPFRLEKLANVIQECLSG